MKTLIAAAAIAVSASAASAQDLSFVGYGEYAVEAEAFETGVGVELALTDQLTVTPVAVGTYVDGGSFDFSGVDVDVNFALDDSMSLYATVEFNGDFDYDEATVGVAFRF